MTEYVLEMKEITKTFPGVKALDKVSLSVQKGTVHALMGENGAGKSTLMKCLFGIYTPDEGQIFLKGKPVKITSAWDAMTNCRISMIHQELHPIRYRSVMENVWLGRFPSRFGVVNHRVMYEKTKSIFADLGLDVDPDALAGTLSAAKLQMMEIARAVNIGADIIIMDEPTSSLTDRETEHLFRIIDRLRSQGIAIIYISHKMEEILRISDEVSIMRDGRHVGTWPASGLTMDDIIRCMVGREMTERFPPHQPVRSDDVVMRVRNLSSPLENSFQDISLDLRRGEILGIGGLVGAQRTEFVEALFGLREVAKGTVTRGGKCVLAHSPREAKAQGLALLTEERRATGIFGILSVLDNTVIANQSAYARNGVLDDEARTHAAEGACRDLNVKTPSLQALIQNLSGGNQQKVLIARWLLTNSDILILDEPTRGIDVGAKYEIYTIMLDQVAQGKSIIMISSEMPELMCMSDRIMVMCDGRVTGMLNREQFDQVEIMRLATQFLK